MLYEKCVFNNLSYLRFGFVPPVTAPSIYTLIRGVSLHHKKQHELTPQPLFNNVLNLHIYSVWFYTFLHLLWNRINCFSISFTGLKLIWNWNWKYYHPETYGSPLFKLNYFSTIDLEFFWFLSARESNDLVFWKLFINTNFTTSRWCNKSKM